MTVGATAWLLARPEAMCDLLPVYAVGSALAAALPWRLDHGPFWGRRTALLLLAFAAFCGAASVYCRVAPATAAP